MSFSMTPLHPEGPRYGAAVVYVPGLWAGAEVWRRTAGLLAHRGWEGWLVDGGGPGDVMARAEALAGAIDDLGRPPVLIAHDAGGLVALDVARRVPVAAVVWVAPLVPGGAGIRTAVNPWAVLGGLLLGRPVRCPARWQSGEATGWTREREDPRFVIDVVRGRVAVAPVGVPAAVAAEGVGGAEETGAVQGQLGADRLLAGVDDVYPLATGAWQARAGEVHRWLVQRLGAALLELHEEAMADRDDAE